MTKDYRFPTASPPSFVGVVNYSIIFINAVSSHEQENVVALEIDPTPNTRTQNPKELAMSRRTIGSRAALIAKEFYVGYTALYMASSKGHIDAVRALLAAGANVDALTSRGATPLWIAAACGHADVVRALLAVGAYVETPCDSKRPLHVASLQGHVVAATLLLDAGADANALDNLNRSPFSCATTIAMRALILARGGM